MSIAVSPIQIDSRVSDFIAKPRKMLIDGKWLNAASGKIFPTYNPATGEVLAQVAEGDRADIDVAVKAARKAFDSGPWSRLTASERGRLVWKLADLLEQHIEEFATLETLDNGKPLTVARAADVSNTARTFQENTAVIKALVAKFPDLREAFAGVVARAVEPSGRDYGTLLAIRDIK